jgi:hypothetical protein
LAAGRDDRIAVVRDRKGNRRHPADGQQDELLLVVRQMEPGT